MPFKIKDAEGNEQELMTSAETAEMITGAAKSHAKKLGDELKAGFNETLAALKLDEKIVEAVKRQAPPPPADDKNKPPQPDPEIAALKARLDESDKKLADAEKARKAAEDKARDDSARNALRSALAKHVLPDALDSVTKILFDADKKVTFDESGRPLITVRRAPHAGAAEEDIQMPLEDGVAHWAKSKEAAIFIPAPKGKQDPSQRGAPPPRSISRNGDGIPVYETEAKTDAERHRRAQEREQALADKLRADGFT